MTPGYGEAAAAETLAAWRQSPPAMVIDVSAGLPKEPTLAPLLIPHDISTDDTRTLSNDLEGLRQFVRDHYSLATTIDGHAFYALAP